MLLDLFTAFTTPGSPYLRRMGYVDEAIAMRGRYRRRRAAWQPHLENTRRFVLSSAQQCQTRNKVTVLGSGLLLDLPLAELASLFREVVLMDVVCLREVRKKIKRYGNVTFIEQDVTNIAERLYKNKQQRIYDLPEAAAARLIGAEESDMVVSLNILSQLWVVPRSCAVTPLPRATEEQLDDWCGQIVERHYASLRSMPNAVCLVADYEFVKRDHEGKIFSKGSTIGGLVLPQPEESWVWNIEPLQEDSQFNSKELRVGAWHFAGS
jgi:hypothetical protein